MTSHPRLDIRKIRIIFKREFRDQLRDRRTLFMVMAFPILLYPALGIGMLQMAVIFSEKPRTVVVLGADSLPEPELIVGSTFAVRWFANPKDASRLKVESTGQHNTSPSVANRLKIARHVHDLYQQRTRLLNASGTTAGQSSDEIPESLQQINDSINSSLRDAEIAVLVVIPDGFANSLE
ncbi:MAG: CPBP family intramembrane glutamate endopeptidase, partial [Planctomycetota bacterium]|nr:CPBP family intramembrane glutamate endopeptidase [Planctomycetota bacterium]